MGNIARDVLFSHAERKTTFCLLIVATCFQIRSKARAALKARTFLHVVRDKVHACYWYRLSTENSAGYLQRVQIFLKPLHMANFFTYKKHPIHRNS